MLKKGDIIFHAKLIFSFYFNIVVVIYIRDYTRKMRGSVNSSGRITIRGMCDFRGWPIIWYLTFDSLTCTRRASATNEPNEKLLARKSFLAETNTKSLSLSLFPFFSLVRATNLFSREKLVLELVKSKDFDFVVSLSIHPTRAEKNRKVDRGKR